ncbi:SLIT1 [Branchiostoma lanceolatum]|uniref:SLIT1 protein n=1 Tax=Branchiostoma lanceolatum TaxID=7740 RepID=A0A8J9V7G8_BRALA|nr:SLIT1 [Branchiostoma lanceolatum]
MESATSFFLLTLLTTSVGKTVDYTGRNSTHVPIDSIAPDTYTVKLSDNRISHLGSFNTTPYIRYLYIDNNRINNFSAQTFQRLRELRVLDLDRNYIASLRDFVFSDLTALWNLYLSNNLISAISERAFHGLASLEFLELSGNRLSVVPMQAIRLIPSKQLLLVSLMVNSISQIPGDLTSAHPSASYLFQGNPLRCPDEQDGQSYFWNTPTGRHMVESVTTALGVEDFTVEDSGMYRSEIRRPGKTKTYHVDLLLCFNRQPQEKQEQTTTMSPSDNFSPQATDQSTKQSHRTFNIAHGVQAMAVCIPLHNLSELTGHWTEEDLNPNAFPLRRLRSRESRWSAMKTGDTIYSGHCGAEAHPADAVGTTEAQVHHYDNDDASNADEEVQYHLYASAEPPLPVYEEAAAHAVECVDADVLEYHLYASAEPPLYRSLRGLQLMLWM